MNTKNNKTTFLATASVAAYSNSSALAAAQMNVKTRIWWTAAVSHPRFFSETAAIHEIEWSILPSLI